MWYHLDQYFIKSEYLRLQETLFLARNVTALSYRPDFGLLPLIHSCKKKVYWEQVIYTLNFRDDIVVPKYLQRSQLERIMKPFIFLEVSFQNVCAIYDT